MRSIQRSAVGGGLPRIQHLPPTEIRRFNAHNSSLKTRKQGNRSATRRCDAISDRQLSHDPMHSEKGLALSLLRGRSRGPAIDITGIPSHQVVSLLEENGILMVHLATRGIASLTAPCIPKGEGGDPAHKSPIANGSNPYGTRNTVRPPRPATRYDGTRPRRNADRRVTGTLSTHPPRTIRR